MYEAHRTFFIRNDFRFSRLCTLTNSINPKRRLTTFNIDSRNSKVKCLCIYQGTAGSSEIGTV